ncbi:MAG: HDIG domain-containing protein [Treponema sp.]|jgi:putative nucleotidyltransferase with HDIG domain|nr:HDIG domain-containing protein [Treponema sp.]
MNLKKIKRLFPVSTMRIRQVRRGPAIAWAFSFLICLTVVLLNMNSSRSLGGNLEEFEVGKVADRDVTAEKSILYEDEKATRLRIEAQERLVPAVFHFSFRTTDELRIRWGHFAALAESRYAEVRSQEAYRLGLQSEFPGDFPDEVLDLLYQNQERAVILRSGTSILDAILNKGIYSIPHTGLENLNPDVVELIRASTSRIEQEQVPLRSVITRSDATEAVATQVAAGYYSSVFIQIAPQLLMPFLRENVFYSPEDTAQRIMETRQKTEPVMRTIEQGKRVIKKGFIITDEDMAEFQALKMSMPANDLPTVFSAMLFLLLLFGILCYFSGSRIVGRSLTDSEVYLVSGLSALYIAGSVLVRNISIEYIPVAVVVPTALIIMLPSILIHARLALLLAMTLPLGVFLTESFDFPSYIFALVSGVVAAYSLQGAEKRMDLVKAGLVIAIANVTAMAAVLLWQRLPAGVYPICIFWAAFNGIASGMLVLGVLPPLEQALNSATAFRLIELSDLNAPILRRLFTVAPGTYSHSIMVSNLAETACQDIGANSLLARVGAYYHDLGKMDSPDYFVENQSGYNRHDDMDPQLSATVIRSHVKLGVEKARQLDLPREVINIISEHHGNSVITWFYDKALKQEGKSKKNNAIVNIEDFLYPGNPPRSRESAVVMLADVAEAAVKSLNKPSATEIEKFIQELISQKVEHGQLAQSELTFRELETIKNAFVQVLKGYYHSRIEYPKEVAQQ